MSGRSGELQAFADEPDRETQKGHQDDSSALFGLQTRDQQAAQDNEKEDVVGLLHEGTDLDLRRAINRSQEILVDAVCPVDCQVGGRKQNPSNPGRE